jgi:outer membrane lipoprotein-sorting protein
MAKRVGMIWLLLILTTAVGHAQKKETLSAQQVLDRMVSVYASCKSYLDKGEVKLFRSNSAPIVKKPFTTAFVRPSQFRFEYTEEASRLRTRTLVVWRDEDSIRSWWSIRPEIQYYETLGQAIRNATGISSQSAVVVPSMLFQNLGDTRPIERMTELSLVGEEKVRGRPAYRIKGKDWANILRTLWIDKETFLLLKLFVREKTMERTILYEPQINVDVPPEKLAFKH